MLVRTPGARGQRPSGPVLLNRDSPQAQGLALWWPLGSNLGRPVVGGVPGVLPSDATLGYASAFGDGTRLTGADTSYIASASVPPQIASLADFTIVLRVMPTAYGYAADTGLFGSWSHPSGSGYIQLIHRGGLGDVVRVLIDAGGQQDVYSTTPVVLNRASTISASRAGATLRVYMDGRLDGTSAVSATACVASHPFKIGSYYDDSGRATGGVFADARIYTRALSDAEHWALYDPATRWDLYWQPSTRAYAWYLPVAGGSFNPAWAAGSNVILGATPC